VGLNVPADLLRTARKTIPLGREHLNQLPAAAHQRHQVLGLVVLERPNLGANCLAEVGQNVGIKGIGLSEFSCGPSEIAHLAGIDNHHTNFTRG
jgi:hypothetical protein